MIVQLVLKKRENIKRISERNKNQQTLAMVSEEIGEFDIWWRKKIECAKAKNVHHRKE